MAHRVEYELSTKRAEDPESFNAEVRVVCEHYAQAQDHREAGCIW